MTSNNTVRRRPNKASADQSISLTQEFQLDFSIAEKELLGQNIYEDYHLNSDFTVSDLSDYFNRVSVVDAPDAELLAALDRWLAHKRVSPESSAAARALFKAGMEAAEPSESLPTTESAETPHRPGTAPSDATAKTSMPAEAQALFGNLPLGLHAKLYTKSSFPEEWFDNTEIIRSARRITYAYKNRDPTVELTPDEMDRVRTANRFMKAYERRRQRPAAADKFATHAPR